MTFKHKLAKRLAQNDPAVFAPAGVRASTRTAPQPRHQPPNPSLTIRYAVRFRFASACAIALMLVGGCSGDAGFMNPEAQNNVIQVSVWPRQLTLGPGQTAHFTAFGLTSTVDSIPAMVTWSATAGTITPDGEYTAGSDTGSVVVTAVHSLRQWLSDSSDVTVVSEAPALTRLEIWPRDAAMDLGDSLEVWAFGITSAGDTTLVDVKWSWEGGNLQSNGRGHGTYKPDRPGRHRLLATADSLADSTTVTVGDVVVASVAVTPSSVTLTPGATVRLTATPRDSAGAPLSGKGISWATSAAGVATVDGGGLISAVSPGTATISATSEGQTGTASVTVEAVSVASVGVSPGSLTLTVGQTGQLTATPRDAAGNALTGRVVTWTTSAGGVATVSSTGLVTAQGVGTATITATSEGQSGTATVTVQLAPVASVSVTPASLSLGVGQSGQLTATPRDAAGNVLTGRVVTWTTSAGGVATVSSTGLVTAQGVGTATITATSEGQSGTATVTVIVLPVASVSVNPAALSLGVGQTGQLTGTPRDAAGNALTGRVLTWTTSAASVATVSTSGLVTGVAPGAATITATSEGVSGTASVTVTTGGQTSVVFSSDWSTARGNSVTAVSDGGRWDGSSGDNGTATALEVVAGTAVRGNPWTLTPNVLAIYMRGSTHDYVISRNNAVPQSTTHWGRCYVMFEPGVNHQRNMHPFAYDPVGSIDLVHLNWGGGTAPWIAVAAGVDWRMGREGVGYTSLTPGAWYRYEWQVEYVTATTIRLWPRVYDMAGQLLYDASGFLHEDNIGFTLAESWATSAQTVNAIEAREIGLGQPGPAGTTDTGTATYVASCAFSTQNWIGPR